MMKKVFSLLLTAALCLSLAACAPQEEAQAKAFDLDTLPQTLLDSGAFTDPDDMVPPMDATVRFDTLDASSVTDSALYSSTYLAELIAVLVMKDEDSTKTAVTVLEDYVSATIEAEKTYRPDEVSKLESAIVEQRGNTVLLVVAADTQAAQTALDSWG